MDRREGGVMGDLGKLTDKQAAFVHYYVQSKNGTRAAKLAGYEGNDRTLGQVGYENLSKPEIRSAIDKILRDRLPSAADILDLMSVRATMDVTPYLADDGTLDIQALAKDGLGHLVKGIKPGREGVEIALVDPQTATKNLARYHRILGSDVQVDVSATLEASPDTLAALAAQIGIVQASISIEQNDTDDSTP